MSITRQQVRHIADLAKLKLPEEDMDRYADQLGRVLEYMDVLRSLPEEAQSSETPLVATPRRADVVSNDAVSEFGLDQAPDREDDFFRVPRILE